ncbi:hypothetical protein MP228_010471 [Amoeboaphelidium protococcarum]|nr:hypothetical protein MP228_010471 [Amoeboaphelidium protococcarum]
MYRFGFRIGVRRFSAQAQQVVVQSNAPRTNPNIYPTDKIRNFAVIAHVDHGKTSLIDCLLKESKTNLNTDGQRVMDHNALERERGITILSKAASIFWKDHKLNLVDTPGHADFGGEVERVLSMVDGVALVVDATEGPMTQTRFVLQKALSRGLKPLVVINKVDRPTARLAQVEDEILDLFITLNASDDQLDYPTVYASAKQGWAVNQFDSVEASAGKGTGDLLDLIIKHVPSPKCDQDQPFKMLVTQLESDPFVGKCYLGRIQSGIIGVNDKIKSLDDNGNVASEGRVIKMFTRFGLDRVSVEAAGAGDIISIAGIAGSSVNHTLCNPDVNEIIKSVPIDPPTVSMTFSVNDSPLQGEDGSKLTSSMIRERLLKEAETNVAMKIIEAASKDSFEVRGRGELHLGILIETMRREGYELSVSPPKVILKKNKSKQLMEPMEEAVLEVPTSMSGSVIQKLQKRKGEMKGYVELGDRVKLTFEIPSRGLLGYAAEFKNETSGQGVLNHIFTGYTPFKGQVDKSRRGSLVATAQGTVTVAAVQAIEARGTLFVKPGDKVYQGMIVGECSKDNDMEVNVTKAPKLTNVRAVSKDEFVKLTPPRVMPLEQILSYIQEDEIIEVTPKSIRVRKKILNPDLRKSKTYKQPQDNLVIDEDDVLV